MERRAAREANSGKKVANGKVEVDSRDEDWVEVPRPGPEVVGAAGGSQRCRTH